jgi:AbrB family looped-hinge helix DNA binding protein
MTTSTGERGQVVIPKVIRVSRKINPGDDFEVIADEDDLDLIMLRRIRPTANRGLVKLLESCPYKGKLAKPRRRPEPMRRNSL